MPGPIRPHVARREPATEVSVLDAISSKVREHGDRGWEKRDLGGKPYDPREQLMFSVDYIVSNAKADGVDVSTFQTLIDERLTPAGVTLAQVQAFIKTSMAVSRDTRG